MSHGNNVCLSSGVRVFSYIWGPDIFWWGKRMHLSLHPVTLDEKHERQVPNNVGLLYVWTCSWSDTWRSFSRLPWNLRRDHLCRHFEHVLSHTLAPLKTHALSQGLPSLGLSLRDFFRLTRRAEYNIAYRVFFTCSKSVHRAVGHWENCFHMCSRQKRFKGEEKECCA